MGRLKEAEAEFKAKRLLDTVLAKARPGQRLGLRAVYARSQKLARAVDQRRGPE